MFKKIKKANQAMSIERAKELLVKSEFGILGTVGENGYPYTVPLNYVVINDSIYFHCSGSGHKLDNINFNNKVSFTIVPHARILSDKFDTEFESVIVFGKASEIIEDEKIPVFLALLNKYSKEFMQEGKKYMDKASIAARVIKIDVEHITGKFFSE